MIQRSIKGILRKSTAALYYVSAMYYKRHRGKVIILTYHRVLTDTQVEKRYVQPGMYVLDHTFERHVQFLKRHFEILSLNELLKCWKSRAWDKDRPACVITFDDGWRDNYQNAYPVLRKYKIPATVFLATDFIGTTHWFWPDKLGYVLQRSCEGARASDKKSRVADLLRHYLTGWEPPFVRSKPEDLHHNDYINDVIERCKHIPEVAIAELIDNLAFELHLDIPGERLMMNWDEVAEMSRNGISFGAHSRTHRRLTTLPSREAENEIVGARAVLLAKGVAYVPVFCYPDGCHNRQIRDMVREAYYEAALSCDFGLEGPYPSDMYRLSRIGIHNDVTSSIPLFTLHMSGLYRARV